MQPKVTLISIFSPSKSPIRTSFLHGSCNSLGCIRWNSRQSPYKSSSRRINKKRVTSYELATVTFFADVSYSQPLADLHGGQKGHGPPNSIQICTTILSINPFLPCKIWNSSSWPPQLLANVFWPLLQCWSRSAIVLNLTSVCCSRILSLTVGVGVADQNAS
jgi:hypothetical protein